MSKSLYTSVLELMLFFFSMFIEVIARVSLICLSLSLAASFSTTSAKPVNQVAANAMDASRPAEMELVHGSSAESIASIQSRASSMHM